MRTERSYGSFDRSIALPEGTNPAGVRATYLHGVLEVRVAHVRRPAPTEVEPVGGQPEAASINVTGA
jgi:HSP20 family molecular chaperone IbpA